MAKKTGNEKLATTKDLPRIEDIGDDPKVLARYGGSHMLIAPAWEYDAIMKQVPQGKLLGQDWIPTQFREDQYGA